MTVLENDFLKVAVSSQGAELNSVFHKHHNLEYLWQADPGFWAKHSPVLFPIVGTLKQNQFFYQGKSYNLPRHGFARDKKFEIEKASGSEAVFQLRSSEELLNVFPFPFLLSIRYSLNSSSLIVEYKVNNPGSSSIYFSIGAHPAFKVPLSNQLKYDDYFLEFSEAENEPRWPITKEGLITSVPIPFFQNQKLLPLTHDLFSKDALVFKHLKSKTISIKSDKDSHGIHFNFTDFPFMGIWAAPNADFVCIEPWCGIADNENSNQKIEEKEGIVHLEAGGEFIRSWSVELF